MKPTYLLALVVCAGAARSRAQSTPQSFDKLGLTITFPANFAELQVRKETAKEDLLAAWRAKIGAASVVVKLFQPPQTELEEPTDFTTDLLTTLRESEDKPDPSYQFDQYELISGPFGWAPYAAFARATKHEAGSKQILGTEFFLSGLLKDGGYVVQVLVQPTPSADEAQAVRDFLTKGVVYSGDKRDPKWSDDELLARWKDNVPKADLASRKLGKPIRTEHYVILSNSPSAAAFAKKMEDCYATIKRTFPFEEVPERRLMPVYVFQTQQEYCDFYIEQFEAALDEARKSKGVGTDAFYATWSEFPSDPVHLRESTSQIFGSQLLLSGGGSWFQEGVAGYVATRAADREAIAQLVKNGKGISLAQLIAIGDLLDPDDEDKPSESLVKNNCAQAALLIEFLRDGKLAPGKFTPWMHAIGLAPDNDRAAIESITRANYGLDLAGLDKAFVEYCKKR